MHMMSFICDIRVILTSLSRQLVMLVMISEKPKFYVKMTCVNYLGWFYICVPKIISFLASKSVILIRLSKLMSD